MAVTFLVSSTPPCLHDDPDFFFFSSNQRSQHLLKKGMLMRQLPSAARGDLFDDDMIKCSTI